MVAEVKYDAHVVLNDQQRLAFCDLADQLDHISRFIVRHARGRLIQQHDLGIGGERHADLECALLGIGEIPGHIVASMLQPQLFEVLIYPAAHPTQVRDRTEQREPVTVVAHDSDAQVLGYAHAGK